MVFIKCYLANKDVLKTETVLCKQKQNQRSVLESTQTITLTVESHTIVCCNSYALHYGMTCCCKMYLFCISIYLTLAYKNLKTA